MDKINAYFFQEEPADDETNSCQSRNNEAREKVRIVLEERVVKIVHVADCWFREKASNK